MRLDVKQIRRLMVERELYSQKELAHKAGLTKQAVNRILMGKMGAYEGTIEKLASALDCDPAELKAEPAEAVA